MVVACTSCQSKFRLDPSKIGPKGARVRCPKCKTIFPVSLPPTDPPQTDAPEEEKPSLSDPVESAPEAPKEVEENFSGAEDSFATSLAEDPQASPSIPEPTQDDDPWSSLVEDNSAPTPDSTPSDGQALGKIALQKSNPETLAKPEEKPEPVTPPPPPQAVKQVARPLESLPSPLRFKLIYALLLCVILVSGLALSFSAMGVRPTAKEVLLLFKYGKRRLSPGVHILTYKTSLSPLSPKDRHLFVSGELFNQNSKAIPSPKIKLEVFTPEGEYQARSISPCCEKSEIGPESIVPFSISMTLSNAPVGSYKVSLEK